MATGLTTASATDKGGLSMQNASSEAVVRDRPAVAPLFSERRRCADDDRERGLTRRAVKRASDGDGEAIGELYDRYASRVPTAELNRFIGELKEMRQAPAKGNRRLNLLYGAQVASRPPRFRFTVNDPGLVTRDYAYWVENQMRERFTLEGVPVAIDFRKRS